MLKFYIIILFLKFCSFQSIHKTLKLKEETSGKIIEEFSFDYYKLIIPEDIKPSKQNLIITISQDEHIKKFSDPDLYVSKTEEKPSFYSSTWCSSKIGSDIISINSKEVYTNETFYISVYCVKKCDYIIMAFLSKNTEIKDDQMYFFNIDKNNPLSLKIHTKKDYNEFSISFMPNEFKHFKVFISKDPNPSSSNTLNIIQSWIYGYTYGMIKGDDDYCSDCDLYILLTTDYNDVEIILFSEYQNSIIELPSQISIYDYVKEDKSRCYVFDTKSDLKDTIVLTIQLFSGTALLQLNGFLSKVPMNFYDIPYDDTTYEITSEKTIIITESDLIIFQNKAAKQGFINYGRFNFCVLGYSSSSYSLQIASESEITEAQYYNYIMAGKSITGFLPAYNVTSYKVYDFSINSSISVYLNEIEGNTKIYGFFFENYETFDKERLKKLIKDNKIIKSDNTWIGKTIEVSDNNNICHQKIKDSSSLEDERKKFNCLLYIIVYCEGNTNCLFHLDTYQSKTSQLLIPRLSVYNTLPKSETDFYKIISDDIKVEEIIIVLNSISGNANMEVYVYDQEDNDYKFVDSSNNNGDLPDVLSIKTYNKVKTFSIEVNAKTFVTYSLYYYVIRSKGEEISIDDIALNIDTGQIVYDYIDKDIPYKIYSYNVDTESPSDIIIKITRRRGDIKFYVYKEFESIKYENGTFNNYDWESDFDTQLVIQTTDSKYSQKNYYYIVVTRKDSFDFSDFEIENYYISITNQITPLLLFENIQHSTTLSLAYQFQSYYYSINSIEDISFSIYADYGFINVYIDFTEFNLLDLLTKSDFYYMEKETNSIFIKIPKKDLEKNCLKKNKCFLFILITYSGNEMKYGASYMINGKKKQNSITTLVPDQQFKGSIDVKEEQYFMIRELDYSDNKENYILKIKCENGDVEIYAYLIEIDNINVAFFPNQLKYDYKGEETSFGDIIINIPKTDYDKCKNCKLLITLYGIALGYMGNSIFYTIKFSSEVVTRINKEVHVKNFIYSGENHYYRIYMTKEDSNLYISLFNVDGDTDIYVNYGYTIPTNKKYHWFSHEPTHQFINIDKNNPVIVQLGKYNIEGDYTIMITGITNSSYTLVVSGNTNVIPIGSNIPGSCKCLKSETCDFKFDLFDSENEYSLYNNYYYLDPNMKELSYIFTTNFLYGYGNMYAKLYDNQDYTYIDDIRPTNKYFDFSNLEFNKRQFMKIDIDKKDKRIKAESWIYISIACNEDSLLEINTAKLFEFNSHYLDLRRENLFYFPKSTDQNINSMPVLSHYLIYNKNLNFEIYSYKGKGKISVFQNLTKIENGNIVNLEKKLSTYLINLKETHYGTVPYDEKENYYNLYFRIESLEDFGFHIKLNYDQTWTKINIGKANSFKLNDYDFYGYFDLLDEYQEVVLSVMNKKLDEISILYVKYNIFDSSIENLEENEYKIDIPKEGNYDFKGVTNKLLGSITIKIPQLEKSKRENKKVRVLFYLQLQNRLELTEEGTLINILVSPSVNYYKRIETQPKQIYFSSEKTTIKDTTIFDINKANKKDNIIVLEVSACRGQFETQINNKITYYKNPFTEIKSNSYVSKGRKVLTLFNATLDTYYLSVWVSGSNCDMKNSSECLEEGGEYLLYYYSTDYENYRITAFDPNFTFKEISIGKIELILPNLKDKNSNVFNDEINIKNFNIFISDNMKDYENMESLCYLSKMVNNYSNIKYIYNNEKNIFIIEGLNPKKTYYINIEFQNLKTGEKFVFKPILIVLNEQESNKVLIGFIIFIILTLLILSCVYYIKYKNTKEELEYRLTEIRSDFDIKNPNQIKNENKNKDNPMIELGKINKSKMKYTTLDEENEEKLDQ